MSFFAALAGTRNGPPQAPAPPANNDTSGLFGYFAQFFNLSDPYPVPAAASANISHPFLDYFRKTPSSTVPAPSFTAISSSRISANATVFERAAEGVRLFGEALAEQSESSESQNLRWDRFGSLAAYAFSVYGVSTFLVALVLNRTTVIASSASTHARGGRARGIVALFRRSPVPQDAVLAFLRFTAVVLLAAQAFNVAVALSVIGANFKPEMTSRLTKLASQYCHYDASAYSQDHYMQMPQQEVRLGPTTAMLWPVFLVVSYSLFVETFCAAVGNAKPFLDGALTLFELSLAIQEMSSGFFFLREFNIAKRPSEPLLLICLFSLADQIASQVGAVLYRNKYRLIPSTVISALFVWYFCSLVRDGGIFDVPSEIALTYSALVLTLAVTAACALVFLLTVVAKGARVDELNFANFFAQDSPNREFFTRYLGVDLSQDFYTAVINLGMVVVTQTGSSSYFSAYSYVPSPRQTWLESDIWENIKKCFHGSDPASSSLSLSRKEQTNRVLQYLTENRISGYSNIIERPSTRMINGPDHDLTAGPPRRVGTLHKRVVYLHETLKRFFQLLVWALWHAFYYWPKDKFFGGENGFQAFIEEPESEATFASRQRRAPAFIRHLLVRNETTTARNGDNVGAPVDAIPIPVPEAEVTVNSEVFDMQGSEEDDESPDFDFDLMDHFEGDSEWDTESDVEVIDVSTTDFRTLTRDDEYSTGVSSAISELMTADSFVELFEHKEILHHHLQYEYGEHGMMTRSRYKALTDEKPPVNQTAELIDLILAKRKREAAREAQKQAQAQARAADDDDNDDDIDPRIACVICQTEPRTLITWPCKCFAICEGCRVSLVSKGMKGCVCCRQDVEGVSRIFLP